MRVVVISPWTEDDPETVVGAPDQARLIAAMRAKNWDVILLKPKQLEDFGPLRPLFWALEILLNAISLPLMIRKYRPELVLSMDGKASPGAWLAAKTHKACFAAFQHGVKDFFKGITGKLKNPDVIANSVLPAAVFWVEDGSGAWRLAKEKDAKLMPGWDRVLQEPDNRPKSFGFVGRAHRIKGTEAFARVAELVLKELPDAKCLVFGPGHEKGVLARWSQGSFPQREAPDHMKRLRVLCSTNPYGNFTLPVVEAMSQGVVPVVFDPGDTGQLIRDAGVLVPAGDTQAMASQVVAILKDDALFKQKSQACLARVKQIPDWNSRLKTTVDRLEGLCSARS